MKFRLDGVYCSRLTVIDDAEQTAGASRTMSRFRHECYEPIVKAMIELKPRDKNTDLSQIWNIVDRILKKHKFKIVNTMFETDQLDGVEGATFEIKAEE